MVETNGQRAIQRRFHRTSQIPLRYVEWKIPLKASSICSFMCGPDVELQLRYGSKKARRLCAKLSDSRALSSWLAWAERHGDSTAQPRLRIFHPCHWDLCHGHPKAGAAWSANFPFGRGRGAALAASPLDNRAIEFSLPWQPPKCNGKQDETRQSMAKHFTGWAPHQKQKAEGNSWHVGADAANDHLWHVLTAWRKAFRSDPDELSSLLNFTDYKWLMSNSLEAMQVTEKVMLCLLFKKIMCLVAVCVHKQWQTKPCRETHHTRF